MGGGVDFLAKSYSKSPTIGSSHIGVYYGISLFIRTSPHLYLYVSCESGISKRNHQWGFSAKCHNWSATIDSMFFGVY